MLNKTLILTLWAILLPTSFASLYYAIGYPILYGFAAGGVVGSIPIIIGWLNKRLVMPRLLELIILLAIVTISGTVAYHIALPLLDKQTFALERLLPLLATTLALYALYILLNRVSSKGQNNKPHLIHRVESILSGPPLLLTLAVGIVIATYILIAIHNLEVRHEDLHFFTEKFLDRGVIPPLTVVLFCWGLVILTSKTYVLWNENRLLPRVKNSLLLNAYYATMDTSTIATSDIYIDLLWKKSSDFYILPRYINWAIPILGFIGTVFGISLAADGIQKIIGSQQGLTQLSTELSNAISPLGIAFDTTLIALSLSVVLTLLQTMLQRWENNILTDCENRILQPEH